MDKMLTVNQKRANKQPKTKKKQPLKVVYITNPIKFKATASEFRALVQELTGQDADVSETSRFAAANGVGGGSGEVASAVKVAAENNNVHAVLEEEVTELGHKSDGGEAVGNGSDPSAFGSYFDEEDDGDAFSTTHHEMMDNFQGLMASNQWHDEEDAHLDVLKSLDGFM